MKFKLPLTILFCAALISNAYAGTGYAGTEPILADKELSNFEKREIYKNLIYLIKSNQRTKYKKALAKVDAQILDYPLYPYLEYTEKASRMSRQNESSITSFLTQYEDTPLANQLRQHWLRNLAKNNKWKTFLKHYDEEFYHKDNRCKKAYALYKTSNSEAAFQMAEELWLVKYSQPDACDSIFKIWREAGHLTSELAWGRFSLAIYSNKKSLASYLTRFIHKEDRHLANKFLQVHRSPKRIKKTSNYEGDSLKNKEIIIHGLKRFARSEPLLALEAFESYQKQKSFDQNQIQSVYEYIAPRLARESEFKAALARIPRQQSATESVAENLILSSMQTLDWAEMLVQIEKLGLEKQKTDRWQYWRARALGAQNNLDTQANEIYKNLAKQRSYYGFLASDKIKQKYHYHDFSADVRHEEILALEDTPGIQRALELYTLNEKTQARREWRFTTKAFSAKEYQIAAKLAQKWGWYKQSIQASIDAALWNDLDVRFPLAYRHNFITEARNADIPLSWSLAVARQESAFMPDAKSGAGALGLMQVLPSTAKYLLKQSKTPTTTQLTNPETNIKIGSTYLGRLLRQFDYSRVLASVAYNAGPSRARAWRNDDIPVDIWIENIPFKETRKYVMNVLMFSNIYQHKLNQEPSLFSLQELALSPSPSALFQLSQQP